MPECAFLSPRLTVALQRRVSRSSARGRSEPNDVTRHDSSLDAAIVHPCSPLITAVAFTHEVGDFAFFAPRERALIIRYPDWITAMSPTNSIVDRLNDPVTLHMRTNIARLRAGHTVAQALESLREQPPEGRIVYFYVTDEMDHLQGVVPTRRLLLEAPDRPLESLMVRNVISIPATATVVDACEFFMFHRLLAFPVVDGQQRLLGSVDVELYTDELNDLDRREGNDELFQLIGVHLTDSQQAQPWTAFRQRFPWLLANIAGGVLAAFISGFFEAELRKAVALALFIPVVLALAESVSIQSVSLSLKSLGRSQPTLRSLATKLRTELLTGTFLGVACGVAVATVALFWIGELRVVACLLGGITLGVTSAAVIGVATPSLLRLLQREPQVAAGPVALATTDMVTLVAYFSLARWLLA